ncbi:hypothetical protein ACT9SR_12895, partial [Enterococcus faecalis]|uniref:hypothetical protein n=1 Tax=Enterococcus faecalis TaxID=1351 RepID=UPI004039E86F
SGDRTMDQCMYWAHRTSDQLGGLYALRIILVVQLGPVWALFLSILFSFFWGSFSTDFYLILKLLYFYKF